MVSFLCVIKMSTGSNSESNQSEDFYAVLNCPKSASYEELKLSYQQLIRRYHPDKHNGNQNNHKFLLIDKAWKTLRDESLRKLYNNSQEQQEFDDNLMIYAQLNRDDLQFDERDEFKYPCRCGNLFVIERAFLSEKEFIMECSECSNSIVVK